MDHANHRRKKTRAVKLFSKTNAAFDEIARVLSVAEPTAQIYIIDGYCAGAPLSFSKLCDGMKVSSPDVQTLSTAIKDHGSSLRNIRDMLEGRYSYNQIRLVLAAMVRKEVA